MSLNRWVLICLALASCAGPKSAYVVDEKPPHGAWAELSLYVTGPMANADKREVCLNEARKAGIDMNPDARDRATLVLEEGNNRLTMESETGEHSIGNATTRATCVIAMSKALKLDERVLLVKGEVPASCRQKGSVNGSDTGMAFFTVVLGSPEAAIAEARFRAARIGANVVTLDVTQQLGLTVTVSGRAYECDKSDLRPATDQQNVVPL